MVGPPYLLFATAVTDTSLSSHFLIGCNDQYLAIGENRKSQDTSLVILLAAIFLLP